MKVLLTLLFVGVALAALSPKQLAGPPAEFSSHAIPSTQTGTLQSRSSFYEIKFQDENPSAWMAGLSWSTTIFVETPSTFAFGFFSPESSQFKLSLKDGDGNEVEIDSHAQQSTYPIFSYQFVPTTFYAFDDDTLSVGAYTLQVSSASKLSQVARKKLVEADAALIVFNESPVYIHSYLSSYETDVGKPIGLITQVSQSARTELGVIPKALTGVVMSAQMAVDLPDGNEVDVQMHDDGLHNDGDANDGIYGAQIIAQEVGIYRARAIITGTTVSGVQFSRSTEHMLNVIDNEVTFAGTAFGEMKDPERMTIFVSVNVPASNTATEFRGYAEVWGKDASGNDVAVCWISSVTNLVQLAGENVVPLEFNLKWATLANAVAPFTLKNAYLIDPSAQVPVDLAVTIPVKTNQDINAILRMPHIQSVTEATFEMKKGVMPQKFKNRINATEVGTVVLVHGYCAASNPWDDYPQDWTNAAFFLNPSANIGTHKFAELVDAWAETNGFTSYSVVGHSQGGMVGTHLHNYFWTGMDVSKENSRLKGAASARLIQSVGTPYLGCSGAGSAANLAKAFGAGCGENYDLTTDGASIWLSGITADSKQEVYYYTTTYKLGTFFGDYCNIAVNMVLEWPNDGTSEIVYTKLTGATNMGNTEKQCHTTDMGYPAQYLDRTRNKQMNAAAAR